MNRASTSRCDEAEFHESEFYEPYRWPSHRVRRFSPTSKDFNIPYASVLENAAKHYKWITMDKEVLGGTPRISGTRIPIYMILDAVEYYGHLEGALTSYPHLSIEQVKEAVSFAGEVLEQPIDNEPQTASR